MKIVFDFENENNFPEGSIKAICMKNNDAIKKSLIDHVTESTDNVSVGDSVSIQLNEYGHLTNVSTHRFQAEISTSPIISFIINSVSKDEIILSISDNKLIKTELITDFNNQNKNQTLAA
jgi:aspartyl-tRNA synthetase